MASDDKNRDGLPTGEQPGISNDVADPHPSTEEHYDQIPSPGGDTAHEHDDIGPNSYIHDGKAAPRPKNKGSGPK